MVLVTILTVLFTIVAAAMVLIILVQRPQGGGLAGAFGGAGGGSDTVFGGRTGDALTLATVVCFTLFLGLSIGLNLIDVRPGTDIAGDSTTPAGATAPADNSGTSGLLPSSTPPGTATPNLIPIQPTDIKTFPQQPPAAEPSDVPATTPDTPAEQPVEEPGTTDPNGAAAQPE